MRIRVSREIQVLQYDPAVYMRVWEELIPKMAYSEKIDMCNHLRDLEREKMDEAKKYIDQGAYRQAKQVVDELAEVISRFSDDLGCIIPWRPEKVPQRREEQPTYLG